MSESRPQSRNDGACENTDREIYRERPDDYYADSIHVTKGGGIGINCGGMVYVKPIREWHRLAAASENRTQEERPEFKACALLVEWVEQGKTGMPNADTLDDAVTFAKLALKETVNATKR
jgi:hypothetical protein